MSDEVIILEAYDIDDKELKKETKESLEEIAKGSKVENDIDEEE